MPTGFIYTRHTGSVELLQGMGFNHLIPEHLTPLQMLDYLREFGQPGDLIAGVFPLDMHLMLLDMGLQVWCIEFQRSPRGEHRAAALLRYKPRLVQYDLREVDRPLPRAAYIRSYFHRAGVREFAYASGIIPLDRVSVGVRQGADLTIPNQALVVGHGLARDAADVTEAGGLFWNVNIPDMTFADSSRKLFLADLKAKRANLVCYQAVRMHAYVPDEWRSAQPQKRFKPHRAHAPRRQREAA